MAWWRYDKNRVTDIDEDAFSYTYRHTLQRPRDFVSIAAELSRNFSKNTVSPHSPDVLEDRKRQYRNVVNSVSESQIVPSVLDETALFSNKLREVEQREVFLNVSRKTFLPWRKCGFVVIDSSGTRILFANFIGRDCWDMYAGKPEAVLSFKNLFVPTIPVSDATYRRPIIFSLLGKISQ